MIYHHKIISSKIFIVLSIISMSKNFLAVSLAPLEIVSWSLGFLRSIIIASRHASLLLYSTTSAFFSFSTISLFPPALVVIIGNPRDIASKIWCENPSYPVFKRNIAHEERNFSYSSFGKFPVIILALGMLSSKSIANPFHGTLRPAEKRIFSFALFRGEAGTKTVL